jgi:hypothetical protein
MMCTPRVVERRGSMLLLAMALTTISVVVAFAFVVAMRGERDGTAGAIGQQQARIAAEQGVAHALRILTDDYLRNPNLPTTMHGSWRTHVAPIDATSNPWNFRTKDTTYYPAMGASLSPGDRDEDDVKSENDLLAPLSGQIEMGQYVGTGQVLAGQVGVVQNNGMARWFEPGGFYESYTAGSDTARCVTPFDESFVTPDETTGTESASGIPKLDKTGALVSSVSMPSVRALYFDAQWQPVLFRHQAVYRLRYALMLEDLHGHLGMSPQGGYIADANGTASGTFDEVDLPLAGLFAPSLRAMGSFSYDQLQSHGDPLWPSWLGLGWAPWQQTIAFARTTSSYTSPTPYSNFRDGETIRLARWGETGGSSYERAAESWDSGGSPGREVGLAWNWQGNSGVRTGVWRGTSGVHHGWGQSALTMAGSNGSPAIPSMAWWMYTPFSRKADPGSSAWDAGRCATPWKINLLTATASTLRGMVNGLVSVRAKDVGVTQEVLEHDDNPAAPSATSMNENWQTKNTVTITISDDQMLTAGSDLWTRKFDATLFAGYDGSTTVYPDANGNGKWLPRNSPSTAIALADDDRKDWTNTEGQYLPLEYRLAGRGDGYWFASSRGLGFKTGNDQPDGWPCPFNSNMGGNPDAYYYDNDGAGNTPRYRINQMGLPEWGFNGPPLTWWMTHTTAGYGSPVTTGNKTFASYVADPDKSQWRAKLNGTHLRHGYSYFWDMETATQASITMARWQWDPYNTAKTLPYTAAASRTAPGTDGDGDGILDTWPTSPYAPVGGRRFQLQDVDRNMLFLLGEVPYGEGTNGEQAPGTGWYDRPHLLHPLRQLGAFAFKPRRHPDVRPGYTTGTSWDDPQRTERPAFLRLFTSAGPVMENTGTFTGQSWASPSTRRTKLAQSVAFTAFTYPQNADVGQGYTAANINLAFRSAAGTGTNNRTWPHLNIRGLMLAMMHGPEEPNISPKTFAFDPTNPLGTTATSYATNSLPWLIAPYNSTFDSGFVANETAKQEMQLRSLNYRRARLMELALNDWRMSLFGSSRDYADFRPLDFDGDGYAMCSAYARMTDAQVSTYAGTRPARHRTWIDANANSVYDPGTDTLDWDLRSAPADIGNMATDATCTPTIDWNTVSGASLAAYGSGQGPAIATGAHFSLTGQFTMGDRFAERKSRFWRVIVRGQVYNELSRSVVSEANKEVVLAVDPDGDCYVPTSTDASTGSVQMTPVSGNGMSDTTTLYQRWFDNGYRALRQPAR